MAQNDTGAAPAEGGDSQYDNDDTIVVYGEKPKRDMDVIVCKPIRRRERTGTHIGSQDKDKSKDICMTTAEWEIYKQGRDRDVDLMDDQATRQLNRSYGVLGH